MLSYQYPTYDSLLQAMITDYSNLVPAPDTAIGSPVWIQCSVIAQAIWGQYVFQANGFNQAFISTATGTYLDMWGSAFGIARNSGELDGAYRTRMISQLQIPASGGTAQDYISWALQAVPSSSPSAANLPEPFSPSQVNTDGAGVLYKNSVVLGQQLQYNYQQYNPVGWVYGDPVQFSSTGTLPGPLVAGTTYWVTSNYLSYGSGSAWYVFIFSNSACSAVVNIIDTGTGTHTIYHSNQGPTDPNSFYIASAQLSTPNSLINPAPPGQVWTWIQPNNESILNASSPYYAANFTLQTLASNYMLTRRPLTSNLNIVQCETIDLYNINITVSPISVNTTLIASDLQYYMSNLTVGSPLYGAQLLAVCLTDGCQTATTTYVSGPAGTWTGPGSFDGVTVTPTPGHVTRLGTLNITAVT